jgi:hypothetical protein
MPRYFMHLEDETRIFDPQGRELQDDVAAIAVAQQFARGLASSPLSELANKVRIVDEYGRTVATVAFRSNRHQ